MSLLRYPGGKSRMLKQLWPALSLLVNGSRQYSEPFVGGGSTVLRVAAERPKLALFINDIDTEICVFWKTVADLNGAFDCLCAKVEASREATDDPKRRFDYWQTVRDEKSIIPPDRAFKLLFMNKTCYGGLLYGAPIGGWKQDGWKGRGNRGVVCQYNVDNVLSELRKANELLRDRTQVTNLDFLEFLDQIVCPTYLDPPYFVASKMYRFAMTPEQHAKLAEALLAFKAPWLLSYDEHDDIIKLYNRAKLHKLKVRYSNAPSKQNWTPKTELLIASPDLNINALYIPPITVECWGCVGPDGVYPATFSVSKERAQEYARANNIDQPVCRLKITELR